MRTAVITSTVAAATAVCLGIVGPSSGAAKPSFGPPEPDPAGVIDLPAGYDYTVIALRDLAKYVDRKIVPQDPTAIIKERTGGR